MDFWRDNVDKLLEFNAQQVLKGCGSISNDDMKQVLFERYEKFDQNRCTAEALAADKEDLEQIEQLEKNLKTVQPGKSRAR